MHSDAASQGGGWWQGVGGRVAYIVNEPVGTPLTLPLELPLTNV